MSKKTILSALASMAFVPVMAGGLVTNTNQNAAFLRQMSQESVIDITGLYANPAGTAFLKRGFHMSLNAQNAKQSRDITTTFPLFAYNNENSSTSHKYHGDAYAPVIPSFQLSYNWERWSFNANFALGGGGGKCEFDNGLGTFESLYSSSIYSSVVPTLAQTNSAYGTDLQYAGYTMNAYMKGRQYYFGLSLGTTYKFSDNVAGFIGLRGVYATNNYNGWVTDVKVNTYSAAAAAGNATAAYVKNNVEQQVNSVLSQSGLDLNTDQTGYGFTPIIGLDWRVNEHWNLAAKYEGRTKLELENKSEMNDYTAGLAETNATLGQFADGKKVRADIPGIITVGAQYRPIEKVRLQGGFHYYFDKQAKQENNKQDLLSHGTWEVNAGVEGDVCKYVTVSAGWQTTHYGLTDAYMSDVSFVTNSNSVGFGVRVHATEHLDIDLGYMQTIYKSYDVTTATAAGDKTDHYFRKNRVLGVGFNIQF